MSVGPIIYSEDPTHQSRLPAKSNVGTSFQRKAAFLSKISPSSLATSMHPCKNCARSQVSCRVDEGSEKCVACVSSGRTCDLAISPVTIRRIQNERKRIRDEVRKARAAAKAAVAKVDRQLEALENQEEELVSTEWQNIAELEADEQAAMV